MDNFNSYISNVADSVSEKNTLQAQALAKQQQAATDQQESQEPLNLLGAELLTSGLKGVRQRLVKKVGQKVAEKTGSKSLGKFVEDLGGGKNVSDATATATSGVTDELTKKAETKVNKVTSDAKKIVDNVKSKVQSKVANVESQAENIKQSVEDNIPKPTELTPLAPTPADYNPRPKPRAKQTPQEPVQEPELDPIEAERDGYGEDLLAPENQPVYTDSDIDSQLQKEAQKRALGDVKPPDRALENIKPYNKPENIKKAQQQAESKNTQEVTPQAEEPQKFDDPSTLPPPLEEPYDPTAPVEGEFTGEGGAYTRGTLKIEAGEDQPKGMSLEDLKPDLPPLKEVSEDEHLENVSNLSNKDFEEYKERIKGIDPLDYSKKTQVIDDIQGRPARVQAEAREALGLDEPEEELQQFEPEEPDPFKGSVENPLTQAEAPAPPPPRPTVQEAPVPPPPPPQEEEKEETTPTTEEETPTLTNTDTDASKIDTVVKDTSTDDLSKMTADSSVFDESPIGDIVTAGLGLVSLLSPLFEHKPKESPINPVNPSSQFGES